MSPTGEKIVFVLGAGVSWPAKLPRTTEITNQVLSGEGLMRHTDGRFWFGQPSYVWDMGNPENCVERIATFLGILKARIDDYYSGWPNRSTNYEDLYYMVEQLETDESGDYDNPALKPFRVVLESGLDPRLLESSIGKWSFRELCEEARNYIRDVVALKLAVRPARLDHLECIIRACRSDGIASANIVTLNHDCVIERALDKNEITYVDGFGPVQGNGTRIWNPRHFDDDAGSVRLLKLHGSIDWWEFRPDAEGPWYADSIRRVPRGLAIDNLKDEEGRSLTNIGDKGPRPLMLVGRTNKMLEYVGRNLFAELHYRFYEGLRGSSRMVVSGYGFGDKGINSRIIEWVFSSRDKRVLFVTPDPDGLRKQARGSIHKHWGSWQKLGTLKILESGIEGVGWNDLAEAFN